MMSCRYSGSKDGAAIKACMISSLSDAVRVGSCASTNFKAGVVIFFAPDLTQCTDELRRMQIRVAVDLIDGLTDDQLPAVLATSRSPPEASRTAEVKVWRKACGLILPGSPAVLPALRSIPRTPSVVHGSPRARPNSWISSIP